MSLETRPLHPDFGLEIRGVDLRHLDDADLAEIRTLWKRHPLLLLREQLLTEKTLLEVSARFGPLECVVRKDIRSRTHPEIVLISNLRDEDGNTLGGLGSYELRWHTDQSYQKKPATGAIFYALEVPAEGGRTYWSNTTLAFQALSSDQKQILEGKRGLFRYVMYDTDIEDEVGARRIRELTPDAIHPLVLVHPFDGSRSLYLDPTQTFGIEGMDPADSEPLLAMLKKHVVSDTFVHAHRWAMGDVMLWDNGRLLHRRDPFDRLLPRLAKRTTIFLPPDQFPVPHAS